MTTTTTSTRRRGLSRFALGAGGAALALTAGLSAVPANAADTGNATLEAIKQCESGGDYTAVNASSGASGAYQFLDSTWQSLSASAGYSTASSAPESVQDAAALELYAAQGSSPWAASESCWSGAVGTTDASDEDTTAEDTTTGTETTTETAATETATVSTGTETTGTVGAQSGTALAVQAAPVDAPEAPSDIPADLLGGAPAAPNGAEQVSALSGQAPAGQVQGSQGLAAPAMAGAPAGC
ncbi:transglycosylase family protein [Kocuria palustris]|uniref:transglycosylase family protein n=1 Tax=Kocuria palustris TaxID=71999 RepID=UPI002559F7C8|nr:transglycosylase family protein [Kocuria palustris]